MPEAKTPDLERTRKRIIADHRKGKKPKELSEKYGVNINTVKSWIKRAKDKEGAPAPAPKKKDAKKKRTGAPLGNTNAVGNRGGTGPPLGSRNALKHGGYSPVYWDTLTEEERQLLVNCYQAWFAQSRNGSSPMIWNVKNMRPGFKKRWNQEIVFRATPITYRPRRRRRMMWYIAWRKL